MSSRLRRVGGAAFGAMPERHADIVFVHGVRGDWRDTWQDSEPERFWPAWLAEELHGAAIWSFDYDAEPSKWLGTYMNLPHRARNLLAHLELESIGQRPLCFVAHSMGGLIVKQLLRLASDDRERYGHVLDNTRGIVFFSTPHAGLDLATVIQALFSRLPGSRSSDLARELESAAPALMDLHVWFSKNAAKTVRCLSFIEQQDTSGLRVIDDATGNPGVGDWIPVDADHFSVCKFADRSAMGYRYTRDFLAEQLPPRLPESLSLRLREHGLPLTLESGLQTEQLRSVVAEAVVAGEIEAVRAALGRHLAAVHEALPPDSPLTLRIDTFDAAPHEAGRALHLDWRHRFTDGRMPETGAWSEHLLPALETLAAALQEHAPGRQVIASGQASLSTALALGCALRPTRGLRFAWRTAPYRDVPSQVWSQDERAEIEGFQSYWTELDEAARDIAVLVSVTQAIDHDVMRAVEVLPPLRAIVEVRSDEYPILVDEVSRASGIAQEVRAALIQLRSRYGSPSMVHIFMAVPVGLAALIGQELNTFRVRIYEFDRKSGCYVPVFDLPA